MLLELARGRLEIVELGTAKAWTAICLALAGPDRRVTTYDPIVQPVRERYLALVPRSVRRRIVLIDQPGESGSSVPSTGACSSMPLTSGRPPYGSTRPRRRNSRLEPWSSSTATGIQSSLVSKKRSTSFDSMASALGFCLFTAAQTVRVPLLARSAGDADFSFSMWLSFKSAAVDVAPDSILTVNDSPGRAAGSRGHPVAIASRWRCSFRRLWVALISRHSDETAALPLRWKRSILRLCFSSANTGSIITDLRL